MNPSDLDFILNLLLGFALLVGGMACIYLALHALLNLLFFSLAAIFALLSLFRPRKRCRYEVPIMRARKEDFQRTRK